MAENTKMRERVATLHAERARIAEMGGADKVAKQHERGKLTARERLARLFDGGEYFELGIHGTQMGGADAKDKPPADAVMVARDATTAAAGARRAGVMSIAGPPRFSCKRSGLAAMR